MAQPSANTSQTDTFIYEPLNPTSIRLLRRKGKTESGMLKFEMETHDLGLHSIPHNEDLPPYHCLSYTWGNPYPNCVGFQDEFDRVAPEYGHAQQFPVLCNGKILHIGKNLYDAMEQLPTDCWYQRVRYKYDMLNGGTELHVAAKHGNCPLIQQDLENGAEISAQDYLGMSPLHYAVKYRRTAAAQLLLDAGADPTVKDNDNKMPIAYSWENQDCELTSQLASHMCANSRSQVAPAGKSTGKCLDDLIWIDAMCINQNDLEERNSCVMKMDSVYDIAGYVLVWLGPEDHMTLAAIDAIRKIASVGEAFVTKGILPYVAQNRDWYKAQGVPYISSAGWNALAGLFSRQWFRRMWVVQEAAFARDMVLYCGKHVIHCGELSTACDYLTRWYERTGLVTSHRFIPPGEAATSVEYYMQQFDKFKMHRITRRNANLGLQVKGQPQNDDPGTSPFFLPNLILAMFPFLATDPRDKFFALLALWKLDVPQSALPMPNYSMTVQQCYITLAVELLRHTKDLTFLAWVQDTTSKQIPDLPSWVPDFSLRAANNTVPTHYNVLPEDLRELRDYRLVLEKGRFGLCGFHWDTVEDIAGPKEFHTTNKFKLNWYWFKLCLHLDVEYHTGQSRTEALWRTLCRDEDAQHRHPSPANLQESFKKLVCAMICERAERRVESSLSLLKAAMECNEHRSGGPSDRSTAETTLKQARIESRQNMTLNKEEFSHVRTLLWILQLLSWAESRPENNTASTSHTPSAREILEFFHSPEWHHVPSPEARFVPGQTGQNVDTIYMGGLTNQELDLSISDTIKDYTVHPFGLAFDQAYDHSKRLFVTRQKYIGLGPTSMEKGDAVYLLPGARAPFILRQRSALYIDDKGVPMQDFSVIGEAYVHGIMHGEAMAQGSRLREQSRSIYLV
ncbi:hypothetical protein BKA63DRAFT_528060 [Paraphoma chrysanthemicola]|nr:hypothetical protein BKA63DRAFT_528060 [Paraphoma chrysanthemicola]